MVFNIKGNDFRLIVAIAFNLSIVYVKFIGTHEEYDKVDAFIDDFLSKRNACADRGNNVEIGAREFLPQDPDGYLLRFSARIGERRHGT